MGGQRIDLKVDTTAGAPKATQEIRSTLNLNSSELPPVRTPFDPTDSSTYNSSTAVTVYDSLGNAHVMSQYFVKAESADPATTSEWNMHLYIDGEAQGAPQLLRFNSSGQLTAGQESTVIGWQPRDANGQPNGALVQDATPDLTGSSHMPPASASPGSAGWLHYR